MHSINMPNTKQNNEISSNINEVIRSVLNYFCFFYKKISQAQKSIKPLTANKKTKEIRIKNI